MSDPKRKAHTLYNSMENVHDWFALTLQDYMVKWGEEKPSEKKMADRMSAIQVGVGGFIRKAIHERTSNDGGGNE